MALSMSVGQSAPLVWVSSIDGVVVAMPAGVVYSVDPAACGEVRSGRFYALAAGYAMVTATLPSGAAFTTGILVKSDAPSVRLEIGEPT